MALLKKSVKFGKLNEKNVENILRSTTDIQALGLYDGLMYLNMYQLLKILSKIPVFIATAERFKNVSKKYTFRVEASGTCPCATS